MKLYTVLSLVTDNNSIRKVSGIMLYSGFDENKANNIKTEAENSGKYIEVSIMIDDVPE